MAAKYRLNIFMNGPYAGRSESYYFDRAEGTLVELIQQYSAITSLRAKMLASDWQTLAFRFTLVQDALGAFKQRKSKLEYWQENGPDEERNLSAPKDVGVRLAMRGDDDFTERVITLCGVPRENIPNDDALAAQGWWKSRVSAFCNALVAAGAGWYVHDRSPPVDVIDYVMDTNGIVTVTLSGPLAFPAPPLPRVVRISGVNGKSDLNGEWPVATVRLNTPSAGLSEIVLATPIGVKPFVSPGKAYTYTPRWVDLGTALDSQGNQTALFRLLGVAKRQSGAPFGSSRGRAPDRFRA